MGAYVARRAVLGVLTLWLVSIAVFTLIRIAPGDAVTAALAQAPGEGGLTQEQIDQRRHELGLDRSWPAQYLDWLGDALRLDAGRSLATGAPAMDDVTPRIAVTLELAALSMAVVAALGVGGGLLAARHAGGAIDRGLRMVAFAGLSVPTFWLGLITIVAVAAWTDIFLAGRYEPLRSDPAANLAALLPAALVLAVRPSALTLRVVRASTLESSNSSFFLMARSKGLAYDLALTRHAFRAAALPAVTLIGTQAVFLLSGSVVVEQVFGLPGLGRGLVGAALSRDYPVAQAIVMVFAVTAITINFAVDLLYARLDPRVRLSA